MSGMDWETLVQEITERHPDIWSSSMFGMPCLKRETGKVVAGQWKNGLTVKLTDTARREAALAISGVEPFDPGMGRPMREWVLVPASQSDRWLGLVEEAITS